MPSGSGRSTNGCTRRFYNYWSREGIELHEPEFPLVALVFDSRDSYAQFSRAELGEASRSIIGYYSLRSNRMIMYDLTGGRRAGDRRRPRQLSRPDQRHPFAARRRADRGHDRPRSDPPARLQQRPAGALCRHPVLGERRNRDLLRDARPEELQRLAEHRRR